MSNSGESRVYIQEGFRWDEQRAYLFDIDGTLLRTSDRIHYDAFFESVRGVMGHELVLDGVTLGGNTDPGILRDAFRLARMEDRLWRPQRENVLKDMCERVAARRTELIPIVMPGVEATLRHLQGKGALLGVATGNLEQIGWIKIENAGLRCWFGFGGFCDRFEARADMIAHAADRAREILGADAGRNPNGAGGREPSVCVVGDTCFDIEAARANGLSTIAVATGQTSFDELMAHRPEVCATTLEALLAAGAATAEAGRHIAVQARGDVSDHAS